RGPHVLHVLRRDVEHTLDVHRRLVVAKAQYVAPLPAGDAGPEVEAAQSHRVGDSEGEIGVRITDDGVVTLRRHARGDDAVAVYILPAHVAGDHAGILRPRGDLLLALVDAVLYQANEHRQRLADRRHVGGLAAPVAREDRFAAWQREDLVTVQRPVDVGRPGEVFRQHVLAGDADL